MWDPTVKNPALPSTPASRWSHKWRRQICTGFCAFYRSDKHNRDQETRREKEGRERGDYGLILLWWPHPCKAWPYTQNTYLDNISWAALSLHISKVTSVCGTGSWHCQPVRLFVWFNWLFVCVGCPFSTFNWKCSYLLPPSFSKGAGPPKEEERG